MHDVTAAHGISKRLLTASFAVILMLVSVLEITAYVESRGAQQRVGQIAMNAFRGIELVGQIGMDVQREHMLIDLHILESSPPGWAAVDRAIVENRADFQRAAEEYGRDHRAPE